MPISRRSFLATVATSSAAAVLARRSFAAGPVEEAMTPPDFPTASVGRVPLGGGLVMLTGPGGNITVLPAPPEQGGTLVIDSGIAPRAGDVLAAVTAVGGGAGPRTLVNTHWHADHTGGNVRLAAAGATVVAHDNTLARLSATQHLAMLGEVPPMDVAGRPVITFADTLSVHRGGQPVLLTHVAPAHTDSDITIHFPDADVLVVGDLLFNGFYPYIDYATGGSLDGMIAAAEHLLTTTTDRTKIVPGHGPLATRADVAAFHDMLTAVRDRLAKYAADRAPLADVQAARPLADLDRKWGQRFFHGSNFIHLVYPAMVKA